MRKIRAWSLLFLLLFPAFLFAGIQSSLAEFEARIPKISSQIPQIIKSAEFAAGCVLKKPDTLINVPYNEQKSFSEEMINRAGGLSNIYPSESPDRVRFVTDHDIVLYSVRSWETDAETAIKRLNEYKEKNWKVILIASKKGMPSKLKYDFFIDNGAPSGKAIYGRINILAN
ncbi:MAG TPA: hypothetical protein PLL89_05800, partial [bacterium]|nr:hypothetical protein [bacterium]